MASAVVMVVGKRKNTPEDDCHHCKRMNLTARGSGVGDLQKRAPGKRKLHNGDCAPSEPLKRACRAHTHAGCVNGNGKCEDYENGIDGDGAHTVTGDVEMSTDGPFADGGKQNYQPLSAITCGRLDCLKMPSEGRCSCFPGALPLIVNSNVYDKIMKNTRQEKRGSDDGKNKNIPGAGLEASSSNALTVHRLYKLQ